MAFDPAVGHRGHRINMGVTSQLKDEIDSRKVKEFNVDGLTVTLPDELRNLRACVPYLPQCWGAPNDDIRASGSDLDWHYTFDLPAPGTTPGDGDYAVTVAATFTVKGGHQFVHPVTDHD